MHDPVTSLLSRARRSVLDAVAAGSVEGHLCSVLLRPDAPSWLEKASEVQTLRSPRLARSADVALVGLRIALGIPVGDMGAYERALARELRREPMPPARRVHEDERLMLGVAAGARAVMGLHEEMGSTFEEAVGRSTRWAAVSYGALYLMRGGFDIQTAHAVAGLVGAAPDRLAFRDAVAVLWMGAELLESGTWKPDDNQLDRFDTGFARARRVAVMEAPVELEPLDAAMALRGLAVSPARRLARRSLIEAVVGSFDSFPAVVQLLRSRPRGREGLMLTDEYDVQWLVHALLVPLIPDIVPEDPAPQLAGHSSRLDFTSRSAKLGIEIKYVRRASDVPRRREELMVDERQYQRHAFVDTVIAFMHDPGGHMPLAARTSFEADLSGPITVGGRTVRYITMVR
jgi:hypothetical protein